MTFVIMASAAFSSYLNASDLSRSDHLERGDEFHADDDVATLPANGLEFHIGDAGKQSRGDRTDRLRVVRTHRFQGHGLLRRVFPAHAAGAFL